MGVENTDEGSTTNWKSEQEKKKVRGKRKVQGVPKSQAAAFLDTKRKRKTSSKNMVNPTTDK